MEKSAVRFAVDGDASLLVLDIPTFLTSSGDDMRCYAVPVQQRAGGMLLAIPMHVLNQDRLIDELASDSDELLGPSKSFQGDLYQEKEDGEAEMVCPGCRFYVVDFSDDVLNFLKEYEPEDEFAGEIHGYDPEYPAAIPQVNHLADQILQWATQEHVGRAHFYSARDEPTVPTTKATAKKATPKRISNAAIMQQLSALASRVDALTTAQSSKLVPPQKADAKMGEPTVPRDGATLGAPAMPRLSDPFGLQGPSLSGISPQGAVQKAMTLAGPPPRTRTFPGGAQTVAEDEPKTWAEAQIPGDPMLQALAQQSSALTALVAHLASSSDPMADLTSSAASSSSSTRGVQRREKLQNELALGTSNFFLAVLQQIHRKLHPGRPVPKTMAELQGAGVSILTYLERFGGYRGQRELGLCLWILGHSINAITSGDHHRAQEYAILLACAIEQAALDAGDWSIAYLVALTEEPPIQLFQDRMVTLHQHGRPFAPMIPSSWSAIVIGYLKELEVLHTKKMETAAKGTARDPAASEEKSPKRKARYPRRPKGGEGET